MKGIQTTVLIVLVAILCLTEANWYGKRGMQYII